MKCREYGEPDSEREVTKSDEDFAADIYAHEYGGMKAGEVAFVEVLSDGVSWELWRVECVLDGRDGYHGYLTVRCSIDEMLIEIAAFRTVKEAEQ